MCGTLRVQHVDMPRGHLVVGVEPADAVAHTVEDMGHAASLRCIRPQIVGAVVLGELDPR